MLSVGSIGVETGGVKWSFVVNAGIELAFGGWAVAVQDSRDDVPYGARRERIDSAKYSNPRPQGQNIAILGGMRTRVRFRIPPPVERCAFHAGMSRGGVENTERTSTSRPRRPAYM